MDSPVSQRVLVVGGGIAGSVVALLLKQKGWQPIILEKVRHVGASGIALVVQSNGMKVLSKAGAVDVALDGTLPWNRWNDWSSTGEFLGGPGSSSAEEFIDRYGWPAVGISRTKLQVGLKDVVEQNGIHLLEGWRLKTIRVKPDSVVAVSSDNKEIEGAFLIGCDGLKSVVREVIFARHGVEDRDPSFTGVAVIGGNSPTPDWCKPRDKQGLNLFWGATETIVTHPLEDNVHLWGATVPFDYDVPESWYSVPADEMETTIQKYLERWKDWHPVVQELVRTSTKIQSIGLYDRGDLDVEHWYHDRILLIGDAAHPTTPHAGQGANQCIEDSWAVYEAIPSFDASEVVPTETLRKAFHAVAQKRQPPTSAVMREALKQGEKRVLRGSNATEDMQRQRDDMLRQKWNNVDDLTKEQDMMLKQPFEDLGGYQRWLDAKTQSKSK